MALAIVRLGTPRLPDEGLRIGTVRRRPAACPKPSLPARIGMTSGSPISPPATTP